MPSMEAPEEVEPEYLAVVIPTTSPFILNSGPPEFPGIDGGVGLQHIEDGAVGIYRPVLGADIAHRLSGSELAQRIADGGHLIAYIQTVGVADGHCRKIFGFNLQKRHVADGIGTHQPGRILGSVVQRDGDGLRAVDDMVVGQHVAVRRQNKAGTRSR